MFMNKVVQMLRLLECYVVSEHKDCPAVEIVVIVGMSRGVLSTRVAHKWELGKLLECPMCSKHQGCPKVEIVEFVGTSGVF